MDLYIFPSSCSQTSKENQQLPLSTAALYCAGSIHLVNTADEPVHHAVYLKLSL